MQSWVINFKTFEYLQTEKAKSKLNSLSTYKKWVIFGGILWVAFSDVFSAEFISTLENIFRDIPFCGHCFQCCRNYGLYKTSRSHQ